MHRVRGAALSIRVLPHRMTTSSMPTMTSLTAQPMKVATGAAACADRIVQLVQPPQEHAPAATTALSCCATAALMSVPRQGLCTSPITNPRIARRKHQFRGWAPFVPFSLGAHLSLASATVATACACATARQHVLAPAVHDTCFVPCGGCNNLRAR
jgi:hypothetical protein